MGNWQHCKSGTLFGVEDSNRGIFLFDLRWNVGEGKGFSQKQSYLTYPEQQECMWATISRPTLKSSSFKKKIKKGKEKEEKGNVEGKSLPQNGFYLESEFIFKDCFGLWFGVHQRCTASTLFLLGWAGKRRAQLSARVLSEVLGPGLWPWGHVEAMFLLGWCTGPDHCSTAQSSQAKPLVGRPPCTCNDGLTACLPTWNKAAPQKINKLKRKLFRAAFPSGFSAKQFNCS